VRGFGGDHGSSVRTNEDIEERLSLFKQGKHDTSPGAPWWHQTQALLLD
jgi:hypothetical protein